MSDHEQDDGKAVRGRPFALGNPGRPHGARNKATLAMEALLDGQCEAITQKVVEAAVQGNMYASRLCMERTMAPRRDSAINIDLPAVRNAADTAEASTALLEALTAGVITPVEAGRVMALLTAHRDILYAGDIERRLNALEHR